MTEKELFITVLKGNREAVALIELLAGACQVMDDIVDGDKPVTMEDKQSLFWNLLVTLPNNPFYQTHFNRLNPVITSALNDWFVANRMETKDGPSAVAYVIRNNLITVLNEMVLLVGGYDHLKQFAVTLRQYVHGNETLDKYISEY
jgi:hypothetical protein